MTDHQRVGESQDDGSQLSDDDRKTYREQFAVMMFLVHCHCFTMVVFIAFLITNLFLDVLNFRLDVQSYCFIQ